LSLVAVVVSAVAVPGSVAIVKSLSMPVKGVAAL
jgi:hypothetical protein